MKGTMGKRLNYFMSSMLRLICFLGLIIAFIVVKITVKPEIIWLSYLLLGLAIGGLVSGIFNLIMCGMTSTGYSQNKLIQIICVCVTALTGGIIATTLTAVACGTKVLQDEIENEKIIKIKKYK